MKYFFQKSLALLVLTVFAFNACKKIKTAEPMGDAGQTLVKVLGGGTPFAVIKDPVDFVNTSQQLKKGVIDIRRDVPNNTELNRTMIVTVKDDTAAVRAADPGYIVLPSAWYTLTVADNVTKVGGSGGTWTFTFKPGEFAKQIYITIPDATLLNPSALYALGFTITSADANGIITAEKTVVVEIGAKNAWDGVYAVTGPMVDAVNPLLVQWNAVTAGVTTDPFCNAHGGAWELDLVTTGANTCTIIDNTVVGINDHPIWASPGNSYYGSFGLVVKFDPVTNKVIEVHNFYGETAQGGSGAPNYAATNTRTAELDPTGANAVQGNKDILIKYLMRQPSAIAGVRTTFNEKWEYVGPR